LDPSFTPAVEWMSLGNAPSHYAADPFFAPSSAVIDGANDDCVLYEHFDNATRTGVIWQSALTQRAGPTTSPTPGPTKLPLDAHASYPFVVTIGERVLCVPQVAGAPLRLFERVTAEDGQWHEVGKLLDEVVLDPTIVRWDDRWWLFGTRPGRDSLTKLYLWHASEVEGPWRPHVRNPVKTDVRSARPAGTPFVHEGRLYRPAQDCAKGYGSAVAICEITTLSQTDFAERVVRVVQPDPSWPFPNGIHTLSSAGPRTLLDARGRVFSRHETIHELRGRAARLSPRGRGA
jgi:hypothetical protein